MQQVANLLNPLFPNGININFYYLVNNSTIKLNTHERGVGFTSSCGTGACASVAYAKNLDKLEDNIKVIMPGGNLQISCTSQYDLIMCGFAIEVFSGQFIYEY